MMVKIIRENEKVVFGKTIKTNGSYQFTVESDTVKHFNNFELAMKYYESECKRLNATFC